MSFPPANERQPKIKKTMSTTKVPTIPYLRGEGEGKEGGRGERGERGGRGVILRLTQRHEGMKVY